MKAAPRDLGGTLEASGARLAQRMALIPLGVTILFLGFMLTATQGHFVPQVVDLYLVCQYARSFAEGHPFQYNPGEAGSTGATSLLHTLILAGAHAVGIRGEGLVAFAILLGAALFIATVVVAFRVGVLLDDVRAGVLSAVLVGLGGPVAWGFLYGSDIALFMFLSLWLFERLLVGWRSSSSAWIVAVGCLLALARPEGLLLGGLVALAWTLGPGRGGRGRDRLGIWSPVVVGLLVLALYRASTGLWLGSSVADKSLVANYGWAESVSLVSQYLVDVLRGLLLGFYPADAPVGFSKGWAPFYFPPLSLLLMILSLCRPPGTLRLPLFVWVAIVALLFVLVSPSVFMGVHFNRYLMWAFPTFLVLVAVGVGALARLLARGDPNWEDLLYRWGAAVVIVFGLLSTLRFAGIYGDMAGEVYRRDVAAADWISRALKDGVLPRNATMANVATSIEYLTGHRNVNLHGVTSPAFFGNKTAEREAGVFESLGRLDPAERPLFLISSVSAQEASPTLQELVYGPPLYQTNSLSDDLLIFRMRYDLVGKNGRMFLPEALKAVAGLREVDRLNVCDRRDEAAHAYEFRSEIGDVRLNGTARLASYDLPSGAEPLIDGGRAIFGEESFRVLTPERGRDLVIVMRTANAVGANVMRAGGSRQYTMEFAEAGFIVSAGGQPVDRLTIRPRHGWDECVFRVPASALGEGRTAVSLKGRFASFYYWFFQ